jgi:hypothetical protein
MTFIEALILLKAGFQVRQKWWKKGDRLWFQGDQPTDFRIGGSTGSVGCEVTNRDLFSDDWEVVKVP